MPKIVSASLLATGLVLTSCGVSQQNDTQLSNVTAVNIPNTNVKWQSIGNCWVYAALGWAEALVLTHSGQEINLSETYLTYRYFQEQLSGGYAMKEIQTGGSFQLAARLMRQYGIVMEGDFVPNEANLTKSQAQAAAVAYINKSLNEGLLKTDRSEKTIREELDKAFGVDYNQVKSNIFSARRLIIGRDPATNKPLSVYAASQQWVESAWPVDYSNIPDTNSSPKWSGTYTEQQRALLKRVMRALNAGKPVVVNWFVDFNALDDKGVFSFDALRLKGKPGRQGYHSTVLEDYTVQGTHPLTGETFVVGEGNVSTEEKQLAAEFGYVTSFIVKNSWGGNERPDRPSYNVDGSKGFHKLAAEYAFGWMPQTSERTGTVVGVETGVNGFVLPPGF